MNTKDNHIRFDVILKALESSKQIEQQLNLLDQLNSDINESCLSSLINRALEVNSILEKNPFRANEHLKSNINSEEIDRIVNLTHKLEDFCEDLDKFDQAIDLLEVIDQLHKKYGHDIELIDHIYKQSTKQRDRLVGNLCDRLEHLDRDNSTEVQVISVVNNLIKCGTLSNRELKLKYLQARDNWFNNTCEEKSSSFDDVVSVYCTGLPMIFNEYKTIFGDSSEIVTNKLMKLSSSDTTKEDCAIINSWLLLKTSIFVASLEVYLKAINQNESHTPTMLIDTMSRCYELTDWLSSIGFDFSSRLKPLFYKALMEEVKSSIEKATIKFESTFTAIAMKSIESLLLPVEDEMFKKYNIPENQVLLNQLPKSIENYPVFTIYCLNIVDSLAWIQASKKTLSPVCLCLDTYSVLNSSMTRIMKALAIITNTDNNSSHPILTKIGLTFITEVLPFFVDHCDKLFPERVILSTLGLSKAEFRHLCANEPDKVKNFKLDLKQIANPLKIQL